MKVRVTYLGSANKNAFCNEMVKQYGKNVLFIDDNGCYINENDIERVYSIAAKTNMLVRINIK